MSESGFTSPSQSEQQHVLLTEGLSKTFGETRALASVDFELRQGEIRALVGGNGSGKSTFVKILAGVYRPDPGGAIRLSNGEVLNAGLTPEIARAAGFRFVHQDVGVIEDFTVAENLVLGQRYPIGRTGMIRWKAVRGRAAEMIERFNVDAGPDEKVKDLRPATRTKVAIARALQEVTPDQQGVLVFDEPTTALPNREAAKLLDWLRRFADLGQAVLFVSHRLDEVLALAETITVFRDGRHVGTTRRAGLDEAALVEMIIGRQLPRSSGRALLSTGASCRLELDGLSAGPLQGVDFRVRDGEVVGIAGLLGSGRTTLLRAIAGDVPRSGGEMRVGGERFAPRSVSDAMDAGIGYVPENRLIDAAFPDLSVAENLMAASVPSFSRRGWLNTSRERGAADDLVDEYGIRCGGAGQPFSTLSGGNQQKVIMARWLHRRPKVLLLDEPSQGVDVLARGDIDQFIRQRAAQGMAVVIVTSDFEELARVSDRVAILRHGRIVAEITRPNLSEDAITELTYGPTEVLNVHTPA